MPDAPVTSPTKRARKAPLTRERVLEAAVGIADAEGLEALSMRRLAKAVGVEAMSLYNHVANKDELLDGMVEVVISGIAVPLVGGDWQAEMRRRAGSARAVLLRHPWAVGLIVSRANVGPMMLRYVDATLGCLVEAGFSYPDADRALNGIDSHIYGFIQQELLFPIDPEDYAEEARAYLPSLPRQTYPYLWALSGLVAERAYDGRHDFEFGLSLILEGLERRLQLRSDERTV